MQKKIEKLRGVISERCDAAIICDPLNQFYFTGFDFTDGFLIVKKEGALLLADSRDIEAAKSQAAGVVEVSLFSSADDLKNALEGAENIAFEDNYVTCSDLRRYKKLHNANFIGMGEKINEIRERKDEREKECIISAQRIAEAAFDDLLGIINPDMTEKEVALHLEFYMRSHGSDGVSFETIAVSGKRSSMPHGTPRDVKLEKGFLTLDFGARYKGYCSDMTRTIVLGKADEEMKRVYKTVLRAQQAAEEMLAPGVVCSEADAVSRRIIDAKYPGTFGHGLGHGVGLYIHEEPRLSPKCKKELKTGNVVTVEPGIYIEGKYGVRIEDMAYITENGAEILTRAPKNLIEI